MWVVGLRDTILHWDGSAWSKHPSGLRTNFYSIWGAPRDRCRGIRRLQRTPCKISSWRYKDLRIKRSGWGTNSELREKLDR